VNRALTFTHGPIRTGSTASAGFGAKLLFVCALVGAAASPHAQDIEPRAYSNAPVGVNFLVAGYAYSHGGLSLDPSLPVTDARIESSAALLAYAARARPVGRLGQVRRHRSYASLSGSANYAGQPAQRSIHGLANSAVRLSRIWWVRLR
jgi:hypothetical protein